MSELKSLLLNRIPKEILEPFLLIKLGLYSMIKSKINPNVSSGNNSKRKSIPKDEVFQPDNNFDLNKNKNFNITMGENKDLESLEEINKELFDTFNLFEEKFINFEKELEKAK